jgi:hypothetical protein
MLSPLPAGRQVSPFTLYFLHKYPLQQFPNNTRQKNGYGYGIDGMHYLKVKISGPVRVLFAEEIHSATFLKFP